MGSGSRAGLAVILSFVFLLGVGCSDGRVEYFASSSDGWAIAFQSGTHNYDCGGGEYLAGSGVYLADRRGIVYVGQAETQCFAISPDGRFVLAFRETKLKRENKLGPMTLLDRANDRRYSIPLPEFEFHHIFKVYFAPGPQLTFEVNQGPEYETCFQTWSPGTGWKRTVSRPVGEGVSPFANSHSDYPYGHGPDFLVDFPPSRWIARHVVWVRPDGSTQELVRQNDAPPRFLGSVLFTPICLLVPEFGWFGFVMIWGGYGAEYDPQDQTGANQKLDRLIRLRKSPPTSRPQPATAEEDR